MGTNGVGFVFRTLKGGEPRCADSILPAGGPGRVVAIVVALVAGLLMAPYGSQQVVAAAATPESLIAYASGTTGDFNIWLVDPDDPGTASRLTYSNHEDYDPVWSQDGSRLTFWRLRRSDNTASLWVIDRDGNGERQILDWIPRGGGSLAPHFWYTGDPLGDRVYYIYDDGGGPCRFSWIYADGPLSQTPHSVVDAGSNDLHKCQPDLSPDQAKVALRNYGAGVDIEVGDLSPDGNQVTNIQTIVDRSLGSELSLPEWSPDGSRIAFSVVGNGIYTVTSDGTGLTQVWSSGTGPAWSPDSSRLTFQLSGDIYVMPSNGSGAPTSITGSNSLVDLAPDWSPTLNEAPTADAGGPYLAAVGTNVVFDGSGSSDPDGDVLTETWVADGGTVLGDTYTAGADPGIYDVCLTVSDGTLSDESCTLVVVYDPSAGFATGGGWFTPGGNSSDPDDLLPGLDGTSRANFGFVVKYKNGASTVPGGNLEFHYNVGSFHLHSSGMEWLVVTNSNWAKFQGTATIDGLVGEFPFRVDARDATIDRFVIKIYNVDADPSVDDPIYKASGDLGGGQIKIHN